MEQKYNQSAGESAEFLRWIQKTYFGAASRGSGKQRLIQKIHLGFARAIARLEEQEREIARLTKQTETPLTVDDIRKQIEELASPCVQKRVMAGFAAFAVQTIEELVGVIKALTNRIEQTEKAKELENLSEQDRNILRCLFERGAKRAWKIRVAGYFELFMTNYNDYNDPKKTGCKVELLAEYDLVALFAKEDGTNGED